MIMTNLLIYRPILACYYIMFSIEPHIMYYDSSLGYECIHEQVNVPVRYFDITFNGHDGCFVMLKVRKVDRES